MPTTFEELLSENLPGLVLPIIRLIVVCKELVLGLPEPRIAVFDLADATWSVEEPLTDVLIPQGMEASSASRNSMCWPFHMKRVPFLYSSRSELILTRSVSEGYNSLPRLRFGLVQNVSLATARSINPGQYEFRLMAGKIQCVADGRTFLRVRVVGDQIGEART